MKIFKTFLFLALALTMVLTLAACGGDDAEESKADSASKVEESSTAPVSSEGEESSGESSLNPDVSVYTVKVTDESGKAMGKVMVQLCKDSCIPGTTDENGEIEFVVKGDGYKASILTMPEGYTYAGEETEFYFEDGEDSLTIVLKADKAESSEASGESSEESADSSEE